MKTPKVHEGDFVLIKWIDAAQERTEPVWVDIKTAKELSVNMPIVFACGFVIQNSSSMITVAQVHDGVSEDEGTVVGLFHVPWGCVRRIKVIMSKKELENF